jgi:hypothetical protein
MGKKNIVETITVRDTNVELKGSFGTVVLDRSRISAVIQGPVRHGYILRRMVITSDGKKYLLLLTDERLYDDAVVDLLCLPLVSTTTAKGASDDGATSPPTSERAGNLVYLRRIVELHMTIAMVVVGVTLVFMKHGVMENRWAIASGAVFSFIAVLYYWTKGPVLRRIENANGLCVINYWTARHQPKTYQAPQQDVVVRTIACRINGIKRVVDILRADHLPFFLVRYDGRLSQWTEADAASLRRSGVTVR